MFRAASGARGLRKAHRNAREKQPFKYRRRGFLVVFRDFIRHFHDVINSESCECRHFFAVLLALYEVRNSPIDQRDIL